jgi:hypothetical protein
MFEHYGKRAGFYSMHCFFALRFFKMTAQITRYHTHASADEEWNAPAPSPEVFRRKNNLKDEQQKQRCQLAQDNCEILERGIKSAVHFDRYFTQVSGACSIFTSDRKALQETGDQQQGRCRESDRFIRW